MKTDLYTKTILTVIAVCLTVNLLKEFEVIPTAKANTTATAQTSIPIVTQETPVNVNISHLGGVPIIKHYNIKRFPNDYRKEINIYSGIPVDIEKNRDK